MTDGISEDPEARLPAAGGTSGPRASTIIVAAVRGIERMGLVVLLVLLGLGTGGVTWFASWIVVFGMPRKARQVATWQATGDWHYRR